MKLKKIISGLTALLMLTSAVPAVSAEDAPVPAETSVETTVDTPEESTEVPTEEATPEETTAPEEEEPEVTTVPEEEETEAATTETTEETTEEANEAETEVTTEETTEEATEETTEEATEETTEEATEEATEETTEESTEEADEETDSVDSVDGETDSGIVYSISGNEITITGYNGSSSRVTIPSYIEDLPVKYIGNYAFDDNTSIISVSIPSTVVSIGKYAFDGCTNLLSISVPGSVTYIGGYAFRNCKNASTITFGSGLETIDEYAFYGCSNVSKIGLPNTVKSIGYHSFDSCTNLTSAALGAGLETIGNYAFSGCSNLETAGIGGNVQTIGNYAFYECTNLLSVAIPNSVTTIGERAFAGCSNMTTAVIGNAVTTIGDAAFYNTKKLANVTFGASIKTIGSYAFKYSGIKKAALPASLETLNYEAFRECTELTTVTGCAGLTSMENSVFYGCSSLTSATLGSKLEYIPNYTFRNCTKLTSFVISPAVATIGEEAFCANYALKTVTGGANVVSIGENAFASSAITSYPYGSSLVNIGRWAFYNCDNLKSVKIPEAVTSIGYGAYKDCDNLIYVTIGNSVNTIYGEAFYDCDNLRSVTFGTNLNKIDYDAFYKCKKLESVALPAKLNTIGEGAFAYCSNLKSVRFDDKITSMYYSTYWTSDRSFGYCSDVTFYCNSGTEAEKYAKTYDIPVKPYSQFMSVPSVISVTAGDNNATITWSAAAGATSYRVYRATSTGSKTQIAVTGSTSYTDNSVPSSGTYYYYVAAYNSKTGILSAISSGISVVVNITGIKAPTFGDTVMGSGGMYIYWNSVPGATSYRLYRATSATGTKTLLTTTASLNYLDKGVSSGKTYYYFLQAYNNKTSALSSYTPARKATATVLTAPGLTDSAIGSAGLYIYWNSIPSATSYRVYRADTQTGAKKLLTTTASTNFVDSTAVSGKTYYYFVAAFNSNTNIRSAFSSSRKITMTKLSTPSLTDTCIGDAGLYLYWSKVPNATSYRIYRSTSLTGAKTLILTTANLSGVDTSAVSGKTYYYFVAAFNNQTNIRSAYSSSRKVTMTKISAPVISSAVKTTSGVKLTWNTVSGATSYRVYRADTLTGAKTQLTVQAGTTFTDTTAVKGKTYYYFVAAFNSNTNIRSAMSKNKSCTA